MPTHSPPLEPLPQVPKPSAPRSRKAVPAAARDSSPERDEQPHIHHPHHEFPFSHKEAAEKQAAAVEEARAAALARLQAAGGDGPDALTSDKKGPRETYDTAASGPSFGHINHWNGHPVSSRQSAQQPVVLEQPMSVPMSRDVTGASFYRIPFGVPVNMALPRPMMLMRTGTGAGMGVGIGSVGIGARIAALEDLAEESEKSKRRDDRSAYVETVEDVCSASLTVAIAEITGTRPQDAEKQAQAVFALRGFWCNAHPSQARQTRIRAEPVEDEPAHNASWSKWS